MSYFNENWLTTGVNIIQWKKEEEEEEEDKSLVTNSRNVIIFRLFITFNMIIELSKSKMQNRNDPYHFGIFFLRDTFLQNA